jgi:prepilin peptidase CpaA
MDISTKKIPNLLSLGAASTGLFWLLFTGETVIASGWLTAVLGIILALLLTLPGYVTRTLGAGDVKLLCAIGLLCGLRIVTEVFLFAAMVAGLGAILYIYCDRYTNQVRVRKPIPFGAALAAALIFSLMQPDYLGLSAWLA